MIECPQCGKLNPENFNYCLDCGAELHPETKHSAESQFFIDLSAKSPDVQKAKAETSNLDTPIPGEVPPPTPKDAVLTGSTPPGENDGALELSPDDLNDDLDMPLDTPMDQTPAPVELAKPEPVPEPIDVAQAEPVGMAADPEPMDEFSDPISLDTLDESDDMVEMDEPLASAPENDDFSLNLDMSEEQDNPLEVDMSQAEEARCWKCGAELTENDKFCGQCGAPADERPDETSGQTMFMHVGTDDSLDSQLAGKLVILEPSGKEGRSFNLLTGQNMCGRTSDPVLLDDQFVSPTHCSFTFANEKMNVKDAGSQNGIYIKVKGDVELVSKDHIRIGQQLLVFQALDDFDVIRESTSKDDTVFHGSPTGTTWGKLLHVTKEGRVLAQYVLNKPSIIFGRETGDVVFGNDGFVSGTHAKISNQDGKFVLTDLGSSNGTYLRVEEHALNNNDMILIGKKLMRFEYA